MKESKVDYQVCSWQSPSFQDVQFGKGGCQEVAWSKVEKGKREGPSNHNHKSYVYIKKRCI